MDEDKSLRKPHATDGPPHPQRTRGAFQHQSHIYLRRPHADPSGLPAGPWGLAVHTPATTSLCEALGRHEGGTGSASAAADTGRRTRRRERDHSRTFCIHRLLHDDLHPLHVVPVPQAVQGLAVLVSERQDLSHGLAGKQTGVLWVLGRRRSLTPRRGPTPSPTPRDAQSDGPWVSGFPAHEGLQTFRCPPRDHQLFILPGKETGKIIFCLLASTLNNRKLL